MFCVLFIIILLLVINDKNKKIRELEGEPDNDIGIGWLILIVTVVFFSIAVMSV